MPDAYISCGKIRIKVYCTEITVMSNLIEVKIHTEDGKDMNVMYDWFNRENKLEVLVDGKIIKNALIIQFKLFPLTTDRTAVTGRLISKSWVTEVEELLKPEKVIFT